jgi:N-acetylglucosaminyl-diphospho-decaprenol L-rhamnosyltransferase
MQSSSISGPACSVCLAILNYNGKRHLEHLLPTADEAARKFAGKCSIVVLDNRSTQDDVAWLRANFGHVSVHVAPQNDYLFSYNWLAERISEDILVMLNNDLKLHSSFVVALVRHFEEKGVFAVTGTSRDWDDKAFTWGPCVLKSHHGMYWWDCERNKQRVSHTLFCCGGFMAVDRLKFIELEGFNRLFYPAYGEDFDLSFRAWRKGWRCLFEPGSLVFHRERGSWGVQDGTRASRLWLRGSLLFQWSSLPVAAPWPERTAFLAVTACRKLLSGQGWWVRVWLSTWLEWLVKRGSHRPAKVSSAELDTILTRVAKPVPVQAK